MKRILVPVAFGEAATGLLDFALRIAKKVGATLDVLHVVETPLFFADRMTHIPGEPDTTYIEYARRHARTWLDQLVSTAGDAPVTPTVTTGAAYERITEMALDGEYDLIVMGTHGRSGLEQLVLGSTADRVVRSSTVPVITVRLVDTDREIRTILVPTDFSPLSAAAIDVATTLALSLEARLVLVHALEWPELVGGNHSSLDTTGVVSTEDKAELGRQAAGALASMKEQCQSRGVTNVEVRSVEGPAGRAITRAASHNDADLIIMGTHGRTGLSRLLLGSVTEKVLRTADCPVLAVPNAAP